MSLLKNSNFFKKNSSTKNVEEGGDIYLQGDQYLEARSKKNEPKIFTPK